MTRRIYITGAAGTGVSSLGRALAQRLHVIAGRDFSRRRLDQQQHVDRGGAPLLQGDNRSVGHEDNRRTDDVDADDASAAAPVQRGGGSIRRRKDSGASGDAERAGRAQRRGWRGGWLEHDEAYYRGKVVKSRVFF